MRTIIEILRGTISKFLRVKILYKGRSAHGPIIIYEELGTRNLVTRGKVVQSSYSPGKKPFGYVWDYLSVAPLFIPKVENLKKVCILGLGAGSVVKLLNKVYKIEEIVGVEIDNEIARLARKFFDLNEPNLKIVIDDAANYVEESNKKFNLVIIDTYSGEEVPPQCNNRVFFKNTAKIISPNGILVVNRMTNRDYELQKNELISNLVSYFTQCYSLLVNKNILHFCLKQPLEKKIITGRIKQIAKDDTFMHFLKKFDEKNLQELKRETVGDTRRKTW